MSGTDALGRQFARHAHPLGGPGGVEDRLRDRADYTERTGWKDQGGDAMALINGRDQDRAGFRPAHWDSPGYWHKNDRR